MSKVVWQSGVVIETKIMTTMTPSQQLELGINGAPAGLTRRRETRVERAHWWFAQMRAAVADAMTWPPTNQPPTGQMEQAGFPSVERRFQP